MATKPTAPPTTKPPLTPTTEKTNVAPDAVNDGPFTTTFNTNLTQRTHAT